MKPTPKKSETLQVRLPHGLKRDFMERCRQEGEAASEVLRGFIDSYLARPVEILTSEKAAMIRKRFVYPTLALAAVAGTAVVLIPRPGVAGEDLKAAFAAQDIDRDGYLTAQELTPPLEGFSVSRPAKITPASVAGQPRNGVVRIGPPRPWSAVAQELIDNRDRDGDHRLSLAEYRAFRISSAQQTFVTHDADHDGRLTRDEFVSPPYLAKIGAKIGNDTMRARRETQLSARFEQLDADHDGALTPQEHTPS